MLTAEYDSNFERDCNHGCISGDFKSIVNSPHGQTRALLHSMGQDACHNECAKMTVNLVASLMFVTILRGLKLYNCLVPDAALSEGNERTIT